MRRGIPIWNIFTAALVFLLPLLSARAQSNVYSVNAVGYVQTVFQPGFNFCCNPLRTTNDTVVALLCQGVPDSCAVYVWDVDSQRFSQPSVYDGAWTTNYSLPPGRGFVIYTPIRFTNTFVGEVLQGTLTNRIVGGNKLSLVASMVPQAASLSDLNFPGTDGDTVYLPVSATQRLSDAYNFFSGYGWFDPTGAVNTNGPVLPVASCFFIQHPGTDTNWVRSFSANNATINKTNSATIKNITLSGSRITLNVSVPKSATYNVQTSSDRVSWKTVATNQVATTWSCDVAGTLGYFRLQ
jgi:hypothetical protein